MCQTQVADSGEWMKAGPGKSSICCRAGAYRLNEKPTYGNLGAALKRLCQPTAAKAIGKFTVRHLLSH